MATFTPHPDLDKLDSDFRKRWAEDLRASKQCKGAMCNDDDTAHCCLCRAAILEGATLSDYEGHSLPSRIKDCMERFPQSLLAEGICAAKCNDELLYFFGTLNDRYLTHQQIADLLDGKTVTT